MSIEIRHCLFWSKVSSRDMFYLRCSLSTQHWSIKEKEENKGWQVQSERELGRAQGYFLLVVSTAVRHLWSINSFCNEFNGSLVMKHHNKETQPLSSPCSSHLAMGLWAWHRAIHSNTKQLTVLRYSSEGWGLQQRQILEQTSKRHSDLVFLHNPRTIPWKKIRGFGSQACISN